MVLTPAATAPPPPHGRRSPLAATYSPAAFFTPILIPESSLVTSNTELRTQPELTQLSRFGSG